MSCHLASRSRITTDVSGPIRKFKRPSGEMRPIKKQAEGFALASSRRSSLHRASLLLELEEQGSYLSIRALTWSCRRRGKSSSLSRESLCFSLRNLVKFSFVMVGLLELEDTQQRWESHHPVHHSSPPTPRLSQTAAHVHVILSAAFRNAQF